MTSKKARLRKPQGGTGITLTKNTLSRARRKAATAKRLEQASVRPAIAPPAAKLAPSVRHNPSDPTSKRVSLPPKKKEKK